MIDGPPLRGQVEAHEQDDGNQERPGWPVPGHRLIFRMRRAPLATTTKMMPPATRSGIAESVMATPNAAAMTRPFPLMSLTVKIQLACRWASPLRNRGRSTRQTMFPANAQAPRTRHEIGAGRKLSNRKHEKET